MSFKKATFKPIIFTSDVKLEVKDFFIEMWSKKQWYSAN